MQLIAKAEEERKRVEADLVSVRAEVDGLRQDVSEVRKSRDDADSLRQGQRFADLDRVERSVSKVFTTQHRSFLSGLEGVFRGEKSARAVADGPSGSPVESSAVENVGVDGGA